MGIDICHVCAHKDDKTIDFVLQVKRNAYLCAVKKSQVINKYKVFGYLTIKKTRKMKKILMTMAAALMAVTMNAQVYVGGSLAFEAWSSQKNAGDKSETVFKIMPEIGYNLNEEWAIGTVIGYQNDKFKGINGVSESAFSIAPYARYTYAKPGKVSLFVDGGLSFTSATKADWTEIAIGFMPGIAVSLTDNLSFVSHLGFIGWDQLNPDGDDNNTSKFGLNLDATNITFGLYYNF